MTANEAGWYTPAMPRRHVAVLLLAVFLGAGTTLPGPDALLHHWSGSTEKHHAHVEPAGGCASHAAQCTLGRSATGAGAALAQAPSLRICTPDRATLVPRHPCGIVPTDAGRLPQSRAPPAPAASLA